MKKIIFNLKTLWKYQKTVRGEKRMRLRLAITYVATCIHDVFWEPWCPDIVLKIIEWFV